MSKHRKISRGDKYGRLTVLEYDKIDAYGGRNLKFYKCKCDCGNIGSFPGSNLGKIINSCGCLQKESRERPLPVGARFGKLTVLSKAGEKVKKGYVYLCQCDCGNTKEIARGNLVSGDTLSCGCLHDEIFDGHKESNYKKMFVEGTNLPKIKSDKPPKNNRLGIKGVTQTRNGTYQARIMFQGEYHHLGTFHLLEDAMQARKEAEEKYFQPIIDMYK